MQLLVLALCLLIELTTGALLPCGPFGIKQIYPSAASSTARLGNWTSNWDVPRTIKAVANDPANAMVVLRGSGTLTIADGNATMSGSPRMYVQDPNGVGLWNNVEVTVYGQRVSESKLGSTTGFTIIARSNHNLYKDDPCQALGYYCRVYFATGEFSFQKEFYHSSSTIYSASRRLASQWNTIPAGKWFGLKFVVRTVTGGATPTTVRLELYLDLTDGADGGSWTLVHSTEDAGDWVPSGGKTVPSKCGFTPAEVAVRPGNIVALRTDGVKELRWKKMSIREVSQTAPASCLGNNCSCSLARGSSPSTDSPTKMSPDSDSPDASGASRPSVMLLLLSLLPAIAATLLVPV